MNTSTIVVDATDTNADWLGRTKDPYSPNYKSIRERTATADFIQELSELAEDHPGGWVEIAGTLVYLEPLQEMNPYHDQYGRFASGPGAGGARPGLRAAHATASVGNTSNVADMVSGRQPQPVTLEGTGTAKRPRGGPRGKQIQIGSKEYAALPDARKERLLQDEVKRQLPKTPFDRYIRVASEIFQGFTSDQKLLNRTIGRSEAIAAALAKQADRCKDPKQRRHLLHIAIAKLRQAEAAHKQLTKSREKQP